MTAAATVTRTGWRLECRPCESVTVWPEADAKRYWDDHPREWAAYLPCRQCGRLRFVRSVAGTRGERKCGPWCTEGYGLKCTCECGGANHGAAYPPGTLFFLH